MNNEKPGFSIRNGEIHAHNISVSGLSIGSREAYEKVQKTLGSPPTEPRQIDQSVVNLREAIEYQKELVDALLRRLEPVSGGHPGIGEDGIEPEVHRVPLAASLHTMYTRLRANSQRIEWAIKALEI